MAKIVFVFETPCPPLTEILLAPLTINNFSLFKVKVTMNFSMKLKLNQILMIIKVHRMLKEVFKPVQRPVQTPALCHYFLMKMILMAQVNRTMMDLTMARLMIIHKKISFLMMNSLNAVIRLVEINVAI